MLFFMVNDPAGRSNGVKNLRCHTTNNHSCQPVILIVDDDEEYIEDLLSIWHPPLPVHIVHSGKAANEFLEQHDQPVLVLLDINLPHFFGETDSEEGLAILRHIRTRISTELPVFIVSHFDSPGIRQRAEELGAQRYFTKPVAVVELEDAITHLFKNIVEKYDS